MDCSKLNSVQNIHQFVVLFSHFSNSSSDSTTSESDDGIVFPTSADKRRPVSRTKKMQSSSSGGSEMERRRRAMPLNRMRKSRNNPGESNMTERFSERTLQTPTSGQQPGSSDNIGMSIFQFNISPLDGDHLTSADLVPLLIGISRARKVIKKVLDTVCHLMINL